MRPWGEYEAGPAPSTSDADALLRCLTSVARGVSMSISWIVLSH